MNEKEADKILTFDTLFTTNQIQMYKILLSYLQPAVQQKFAIYIKFMELQYTMSFFQNHPLAILTKLPHEEPANSGKIMDELLPFCDNFQRNKLNQMKNMLQNLENMKEMMETIQLMKELFPEGMENGVPSKGSMDMSQLFSMFGGGDMSGMENMFEIFNTQFSRKENE